MVPFNCDQAAYTQVEEYLFSRGWLRRRTQITSLASTLQNSPIPSTGAMPNELSGGSYHKLESTTRYPAASAFPSRFRQLHGWSRFTQTNFYGHSSTVSLRLWREYMIEKDRQTAILQLFLDADIMHDKDSRDPSREKRAWKRRYERVKERRNGSEGMMSRWRREERKNASGRRQPAQKGKNNARRRKDESNKQTGIEFCFS